MVHADARRGGGVGSSDWHTLCYALRRAVALTLGDPMRSPSLPIARWLPAYRRADARADLIAGLTVTVMLVPQAMAYAMLAGLPPQVGLYAATVPMVMYALFGTCRQLAMGPVATDSLLVMIGLSAVATPGSSEYVGLAVTLMALVGAIQLTLGLLRAGFVVNFLSTPVVSGFMSAAALIIGASQLGQLLGVPIDRGPVHQILADAAGKLGAVHAPTLALGLMAIATLLLLKRFAPRIPGALVVVLGGILAVVGLDLADTGVAIIGAVPAGLPPVAIPRFERIVELLPIALTLALVGFTEAISVGRFFARKHRYAIDPDQELIALGMANLGGSFFSGYPVTSGLSRSAVADRAGARTPMAALVTAAGMVLVLLLLTPLFAQLPKAALAAIIMVAVINLIGVAQVRLLWRTDRVDLGILALTFGATLGWGILPGILSGIAASIFVFVARRTRPHYAVLGRLPAERIWRQIEVHPEAEPEPGVLVLRFDVSFYFGNVQFLQDCMLRALDADPQIVGVVLDMQSVNAVDSSASAVLLDLVQRLDRRDVRLVLAAVKAPVQHTIRRHVALADALSGRCHLTVEAAVQHVKPEPPEPEPTSRRRT